MGETPGDEDQALKAVRGRSGNAARREKRQAKNVGPVGGETFWKRTSLVAVGEAAYQRLPKLLEGLPCGDKRESEGET